MIRTALPVVAVVVAIAASASLAAPPPPPTGILAATVGDRVVLVEAGSGLTAALEAGPVGWLYPGPGGILFAPDVINGRTTVIDLRTQAVADRIDGLTMPHFGDSPDRYVALAGDALLVSYPDRALITRIATAVVNPWQVLMAPDDAAMLVLERLPDGSTGIHMSVIDLVERKGLPRVALAGDIVHMALSPKLGLLALADAGSGRVQLVVPATVAPVAVRPVSGRPVDVAFVGGGRVLATAVATPDGNGTLDLALFKSGRKGLRLDKEHALPLGAPPVRLAASPDGRHLAVALEDGSLILVNVDERVVVASHRLPGTPRDLRWCDPSRPGPMLPEWSEGEGPAPDFKPFAPPIGTKKSANGLDHP
jgi:hypothetical protein